jgi:PIN domain nuclease of toxin-antitoxin system
MSLAVLLDTHALLWWAHQPELLSRRAHDAISDGSTDIFVSPVSAIEIATKTRMGKLQFESPLADDFVAQIALDDFKELPITSEHAQLAGSFDNPHQDPWDRLLAAQAQLTGLALITNDDALRTFGVETLW